MFSAVVTAANSIKPLIAGRQPLQHEVLQQTGAPWLIANRQASEGKQCSCDNSKQELAEGFDRSGKMIRIQSALLNPKTSIFQFRNINPTLEI